MKKTLVMAVILLGSQAIAQTIVRSSTDSGGESVSDVSIQVLYTIGEVVVGEISSGDIILSEGFINGTSITLSNYDDKLLNKFLLYPNPTKGILSVNGDTSEITSIEIYSLLGSKLMTMKNGYEEINLNEFENAVYFVKLTTMNASKTVKIIKQ